MSTIVHLDRFQAARDAILARAKRAGISTRITQRAVKLAYAEMRQGRSTAAAIALAWSEIGGPRCLRLRHHQPERLA